MFTFSYNISRMDNKHVIDERMMMQHYLHSPLDIYIQQCVVELHKLRSHHIVQCMDQRMNNWYMHGYLDIPNHFDIHHEHNDSMDYRCILANMCTLEKKRSGQLNLVRYFSHDKIVLLFGPFTWTFSTCVVMTRSALSIL